MLLVKLKRWKINSTLYLRIHPVSYTHLDVYKRQGQKYTLHDDSADITAECVNRLDKIVKNNVISLFDRTKIGL